MKYRGESDSVSVPNSLDSDRRRGCAGPKASHAVLRDCMGSRFAHFVACEVEGIRNLSRDLGIPLISLKKSYANINYAANAAKQKFRKKNCGGIKILKGGSLSLLVFPPRLFLKIHNL